MFPIFHSQGALSWEFYAKHSPDTCPYLVREDEGYEKRTDSYAWPETKCLCSFVQAGPVKWIMTAYIFACADNAVSRSMHAKRRLSEDCSGRVHLGYFASATAGDCSSQGWCGGLTVVRTGRTFFQAPPTASMESSRGRSLREIQCQVP